MRILITNISLSGRSGTETVVRDLAIGLVRAGHLPVVFSPFLRLPGQTGVADEIRQALIPVIDDLDALTEIPDIIHGNHLHETVTACMRFPRTPAVWTCHSWDGPHDRAPKVPTLMTYLAVDEACSERLLAEESVPSERVSLMLNCVDLSRFRQREALPDRPQRALVLSHYAANTVWFEEVQEACRRSGLALDAFGNGLGSVTNEPENLFPKYDLVFAVDRTAMEATAVGNSVILCGQPGLGPMVTADNCEALYKQNFGRKWLNKECSADSIVELIAQYSPSAARAASGKIRTLADSDTYIKHTLSIYQEAIDRFSTIDLSNAELEMLRAVSSYCTELSTSVRNHIFGNAAIEAANLERNLAIEMAERRRLRLTDLERQRHEVSETARLRLSELDECRKTIQALELCKEASNQELTEVKAKLSQSQSDLQALLQSKTMVLKNRVLSLLGLTNHSENS
ncbi:MAG TPA: glycosyltransferase family 4 protein [Oculatellaceae cyanobacterium]